MQQVTCEGGEKEEKVELIIHIETYNLGAPLSPLSLLCRMAPSLWASNLYTHTHIYIYIYVYAYIHTHTVYFLFRDSGRVVQTIYYRL